MKFIFIDKELEMDANEIMQVILNNTPKTVKTPDGAYPVCIPALRTNICARCGKMINREQVGACSAIPPEDRFNFINEDEV